MKNLKKSDIIKFIFFVLFFISIIVLGVSLAPQIKKFKNIYEVREIINSYKGWSFLIYIFLQVFQVVIFIIPGDIINITGGYIFGLPLGAFLSIIGVWIGTIIAFFISRFLGYGFISKFIKEEKINKINKIINSNVGTFSLFIFCNIPFVPKDILMYAAGLTPVKAQKILTIYCLSRIPGIVIWTSVGANVYDKNILGLIITFLVLAIFLLLITIIKKNIEKKKKIKLDV